MIRLPMKRRSILILVGVLGCLLVLKNIMLSSHTKDGAKTNNKAIHSRELLNRAIQRHSREISADKVGDYDDAIHEGKSLNKDVEHDAVKRQEDHLSDTSLDRALKNGNSVQKHDRPQSQRTAHVKNAIHEEKSLDKELEHDDGMEAQKDRLSDQSLDRALKNFNVVHEHDRPQSQRRASVKSNASKRKRTLAKSSKSKQKYEYDSNVVRYKDNPYNGVQPTEQLRVPDGSLTPSLVYFIWCGKKWFEFQHYLSFRSAIRFLNADRIIMYYTNIPKIDEHRYNKWFDELMDEYPWFTKIRFKADELGACKDDLSKRAFAQQKLSKTGGIYMTETTILTSPVNTLRKYPLVEGLQDGRGFMMVNKKAKINGTQTVRCSELILKRKDAFVKLENGNTVESHRFVIDEAAGENVCITMPRTPTFVYPKDIWALDNAFGRAARDIFYGSPDIPKVRHSKDDLAPNIAHMVLLGGRKMEYICYIGMLSLLHVVKVEKLYIHGDKVPIGDLWDKINKDDRVEYVFHDLPKSVYSTEDNFLPQHVSDMMRVDIMIKYGGLYVDTDAIFVKPLDDHIRGYDVVATYDWATGWVPPWPDIINFGVTLGKRGAPFWHLFQHSMKDWWEKNWSYNGLQKPYKVYERHPHLVKINPHWQVICFGYEYGCHPTWIDWPTYFNRNTTHRQNGINWRKDAYAFHWTDPTPPTFWGENHLIKHKMDEFYQDFSAEVGRFVLEKAGLLNETIKRVGDKEP